MLQDLTDDQSTMIQVTAWCRQASGNGLALNRWQGNTVSNTVSTVATDALVLKHQAISIHNADWTFIVLDQFDIKISHLWCTTLENKIMFWKK